MLLLLLSGYSAAALTPGPLPSPPMPDDPLPVLPGLNADYLDSLDSAQFLRSDEDGTLAGRLVVTEGLESLTDVTTPLLDAEEVRSSGDVLAAGDVHASGALRAAGDVVAGGSVQAAARLSADAVCIDDDCRDTWPLGLFDAFRTARGRTQDFQVYSPTSHALGYFGGTPDPEPRIMLGDLDQPAFGFVPQGATVTYGFRFHLYSPPASGTGSSVLVKGPVTLLQYGSEDPAAPAGIRIQYIRTSDGSVVIEDWTTYANGGTYLEVAMTVGGEGHAGVGRSLDVVLTKDGGAKKTLQGVSYVSTSPLLAALPPSSVMPATHHLLAAAGRVQYP